MLHDRPLSLCNNQAVTSAATGRRDAAFPTNNHPARQCSAKLKDGFSLSCPVKLLAEKQLTRNQRCCLWKAVKEQPSAHRCTEQQTLPTDTMKPQSSRPGNHGMVWLGRDLKSHGVLVPFHGQGHLSLEQGHSQGGGHSTASQGCSSSNPSPTQAQIFDLTNVSRTLLGNPLLN